MPLDQARYERLRMELVDRNEANIPNVYLDVLGIPTVGLGVALTARQRDRTMALDNEHIDALADVTNLNPSQRHQLVGILERHLAVQNQHLDERYSSLRDFLASDFGRDSREVLGTMVNTRTQSPNGSVWSWDVLTSADSPMQIRLTRQQTLQLFQRVAPEYEGRLNRTLRNANCPAEALSEEQRAAIYSMVYHGASGKAQRTAIVIGDYWRGEIDLGQLHRGLRTAVNDPEFPERSRNELEFLTHIRERLDPARDKDSVSVGHVLDHVNDPNNFAEGMQKAIAGLGQRDRLIFERLRKEVPDAKDEVVLQAVADIRVAGLLNASAIDKAGMHNGALFIIADHSAGYAHSKTLADERPQPQSALAQLERANQEYEALDQQVALQRQQSV